MTTIVPPGAQTYEEKVAQFIDMWMDLFSNPFTTGELRATIKKYPIAAFPDALGIALWRFSLIHPNLMEPIVANIRIVLKNKKLQHFRVTNEAGMSMKFGPIFYQSFGDTVSDFAHNDWGPPEEIGIFRKSDGDGSSRRIHPILVSAFAIAAAHRTKLMTIDDYCSMTLDGLQIPGLGEAPESRDVQELAAIAALILFETQGAEQYTKLLYSPEAGGSYELVLKCLEDLRRKGIIRYLPAVKLLEVSRSPAVNSKYLTTFSLMQKIVKNVEKHDREERSVSDVYDELFAPE
ncbi:hypothetical protein EST38_g10730 [Candolleomyces aberdarensis]|uniref:Uncharacterized protein n=1 Tax=Candolleomyces aberdarensis TaxID=2316362 RepID=A0A4Q2D6N8_9AGAR|nr:hypothetical protein EST38_g10730 [Candolleomyces aberdarensis]